MEHRAELLYISRDWKTGKTRLLFEVDGSPEEAEKYTGKKLRLKAVEWRDKRSLDANALLWHCIGEISKSIQEDKWKVYLNLLKHYGKYTYIVVKEKAVEAVKKQWRETEVVGDIDINGTKGVQMLCYFGSSNYDSREFSRLLDGTIQEMKNMGLELPEPENIRRALEIWEKYGRKSQDTVHTKQADPGK